jgi:hypothetical protein
MANRHRSRRGRVAVARGAALDDVADEHLVAGQTHGLDHLGQQLTGPANKGQPLGIFIRPRSFSDEHESGSSIALPEHGLDSRPAQATLEAPFDLTIVQGPEHFLATGEFLCGDVRGGSHGLGATRGYRGNVSSSRGRRPRGCGLTRWRGQRHRIHPKQVLGLKVSLHRASDLLTGRTHINLSGACSTCPRRSRQGHDRTANRADPGVF